MSILRNKLREKFSTIPNDAIADLSISHGAFRVLTYLFSRPDGWKIFNADIQKTLGIGKGSTLPNYWKELLLSGWLTRKRVRMEVGKVAGGYDYILNEKPIMPIMDNMDKNTVYTKNSDTAKNNVTVSTIIGNTNNCVNGKTVDHINTDLISKTELKEKERGKLKSALTQRKTNFEKNALEKCLPTQDQQPDFSKFIIYWTEHNPDGNKMRFEVSKIFNVLTRWKSWLEKSAKWQKSNVRQINSLNKKTFEKDYYNNDPNFRSYFDNENAGW